MGLCLQCNKWVTQTEGKRAKLFCNDTCRSNFRYAKNKMGKIQFASPQSEYNGPKLPDNFKGDEPLFFEKLRQEGGSENTRSGFESRLYAADCGEELQSIGLEIDRSSLPRFEKQRLQAIGQRIFNEKFNF